MLSSKLRVLVTRAVFPSVIERLSQHFIVESNPDDVLWDREELLRRAEDKDGMLVFGTERVDAELLSRCPRLRIAANMTVGYNNFDIPAMTQARVLGTNAPDVLTETTVLLCCISPVSFVFFCSCVAFLLTPACPQADFGFGLLMATARRVTESEHFLRAGLWTRWRYDMYYSSSFPLVPTSHSAVTSLQVCRERDSRQHSGHHWDGQNWPSNCKASVWLRNEGCIPQPQPTGCVGRSCMQRQLPAQMRPPLCLRPRHPLPSIYARRPPHNRLR